ncbi:serine/threonine-protein kinase [Nannocystaceae bacterium ST9]
MDPLIPVSLLRPSAQDSLARLGKPVRKSVTPSWLVDPDDDRLVGGTMLAHTKQYRIESCIGEGGMGWVYKAWDPILERPVALKVMKPDVPASERDRFRMEAVWGARFCHPAIARVFDLVGVPGQGISWFVMEFLPGRDLGTLITRARTRGTRIPMRLIADVFRQILAALQYSHDCGVVHRDVKPDNMFVTRDPNTRFVTSKLLDFGVALERATPKHEQRLVGDPRYIAPEQTEFGREVDGRADVYAAGMSLFEALANQHPWPDLLGEGGTLAGLLHASRERALPALAPLIDEVDPGRAAGLEAVVRKACAKRPEDRFASARAMQEALLCVLLG